ncbi:stage III sporulation protein AA [Desulfotomaculum copahuensis]|uniref:Stage III sporulation protein AA n=1 Tax=Desulfotomaculum copahuensis TaxID=1838280 RepID=A0A1B7LJ51_9FIRM|nr:stage III sporulation protein AA [Desulfotomaculum copahuensis]
MPAASPGAAVHEVLPVLPGHLRNLIAGLPPAVLNRLEEIRLRRDRPLMLGLTGGDAFIAPDGKLVKNPRAAYLVSACDLEQSMQLISGSSLYALEEELRNGYITVSGGHRVGLAGRAVVEGGRIKTLKQIAALNIRISREIAGLATPLMPHLFDRGMGRIYHTLIFSPPGCGKTTLLRDIIRQISNGVPEIGLPGMTVGVVDERSELAGCHRGVPQRDVGVRTDVLDGCPKAEGMIMLLRSMAPRVIATDEIGRKEDVAALEEVFNAGVGVLVTVHGSSLNELTARPALNYLFSLKVIQRLILLGRSRGVGSVEDIIDGRTMHSLGVRLC